MYSLLALFTKQFVYGRIHLCVFSVRTISFLSIEHPFLVCIAGSFAFSVRQIPLLFPFLHTLAQMNLNLIGGEGGWYTTLRSRHMVIPMFPANTINSQ